jgi:hypothetical protein
MMITNYSRVNFHKYTFCLFQEVDLNAIQELKLNYKSKSGSSYYFTDEGVFRLSNHWSRVANCRWRLVENTKLQKTNCNKTKLGFAKWTDFFEDNEYDTLYFIEVDFEKKIAHFYHKQNSIYQSKYILRTASDTTKIIKQIRVLLQETAWTKYLKELNIEVLRKEIIEKLITSNATFHEIRRNYLP